MYTHILLARSSATTHSPITLHSLAYSQICTEAIEFIAKAKAEGKDPTETSQLLAKHALDLGSFDNVTIITIYLDWKS
jgi:hypothetical protein